MTTGNLAAGGYEPQGIRVGVVRGISYGLFGPPGEFIPQVSNPAPLRGAP